MKRPELGARVSATDRLYRHREYRDGKKTWVRFRGLFRFKTERLYEGIYIGYRTIQDGKTSWEGEEIGNIWIPSRHFECWLIVEDPRQKPIRVLPEDVIIL